MQQMHIVVIVVRMLDAEMVIDQLTPFMHKMYSMHHLEVESAPPCLDMG